MIENEQEVIDYLKKEENKDFLSKNGFSKVETKVETKEVKVPLTEDEVKAFVEGNKELKSKLSEEMVKGYLKEKLGIDINDETLKQGLVLGGTVENIKKLAVGKILSGVKYGDLLMSKIDFTKINFKDDKIEGLDEQLTKLQETYKDLFNPAGTGGRGQTTPPGLPKMTPSTELEKINQEIEELSKKPSQQNRAKIMVLISKKEELEKK